MVKFSALLFLLVSSIGYAQDPDQDPIAIPIDSTTGQIKFQQVVTVNGDMSVTNIIQATRKWVAQSYKDANKVIQQYDAEGGLLVGKGHFPIIVTIDYKSFGDKQMENSYDIHHVLTVEAKPGRCRITMDGFQIQLPQSTVSANPYMPKSMYEAVAYNPGECFYTGERYKELALKEMERLGYGGKMYTKGIDKQLPAQIKNGRRRCAALKREAERTIESLKQSLQKSASESKW